MDPTTSYMISYAVFGFIILALFIYAFVYNRFFGQQNADGPRAVPRAIDEGEGRQVARRRQQARHVNIDDDDDFRAEAAMRDVDDAVGTGKKIGAKKLKKLEEKEARRQQNEQIKQDRAERAEREKQLEAERKAKEAEEEALRKEKEEEEKKRQEEIKKAEDELYQQMKAAFAVEQEGSDLIGEDEEKNMLYEFIEFVKTEKIVTLEDLAARFKLRVQDTIDRLQRMMAEGLLTGVVDERGKFVYVSKEELEAVAEYIRQRGRVSFTELVNSSQLIAVPQKKAITTVTE